ncbi:MAG: hypothetical protein HKN43_08905 [Rhodothermales bacterium]|nr:hypothetical protein [Rhodothermales bacterium]
MLPGAATGVTASDGQMGHGSKARRDTARLTLDADQTTPGIDCGSSRFEREEDGYVAHYAVVIMARIPAITYSSLHIFKTSEL